MTIRESWRTQVPNQCLPFTHKRLASVLTSNNVLLCLFISRDCGCICRFNFGTSECSGARPFWWSNKRGCINWPNECKDHGANPSKWNIIADRIRVVIVDNNWMNVRDLNELIGEFNDVYTSHLCPPLIEHFRRYHQSIRYFPRRVFVGYCWNTHSLFGRSLWWRQLIVTAWLHWRRYFSKQWDDVVDEKVLDQAKPKSMTLRLQHDLRHTGGPTLHKCPKSHISLGLWSSGNRGARECWCLR